MSEHVLAHRDGDLYWWISHGIAGTPMPGFEERLESEARWDLVNFVRTLAGAAMMAPLVPAGMVEAPKFTYQIGRNAQQSIPEANSQAATLLVLYRLPQSRDRVLALAGAAASLARAGMNIVAVPMRGEGAAAPEASDIAAIVATAPGVAETYRVLGGDAHANRGHLEFLIDRGGWLRATWDASNEARLADLAAMSQRLDADRSNASRPAAHGRGH